MALTKELWVAYTRIFFVEAAYWIISIGMVFINESVLKELVTDDLTIFITIFQILFSLSTLLTLNFITKHYLNDLLPVDKDEIAFKTVNDDLGEDNDEDETNVNAKLINNQDSNWSEKQPHRKISIASSSGDSSASQDSLKHLLVVNIPHRINLESCRVVFPLSILYIGMLLLNNFCLRYVGVAFYFVSRSLTTVFNVIFTYFLINEPVSRGALICCGFIVLGFLLGIDQESVVGSLSVIGVVYGVASSLFTSLFSIYTKKTLAKLDRNIWTLVLYNNINAILLCTPLLIVHGDIQALISDKVINPTFWTLLSISGVVAFFISIVTNASIKYTSPLTHNISGTAKACLQTVIAVIYHHDHKSMFWWLSNVTILIASASYSRIKQLEMEKRTLSLSKQEVTKNKPTFMTDARETRQRDSSTSSGCSATSEMQSSQNDKDSCCLVKFQPEV